MQLQHALMILRLQPSHAIIQNHGSPAWLCVYKGEGLKRKERRVSALTGCLCLWKNSEGSEGFLPFLFQHRIPFVWLYKSVAISREAAKMAYVKVVVYSYKITTDEDYLPATIAAHPVGVQLCCHVVV